MRDVTLFAAANMKYFYKHGYAFAKSAVDNGNYVHIITWHDEVNSTSQREFMVFMGKFFEKIDPDMCRVQLLSHNTMDVFRHNLKIVEERAFYASIRFLMLGEVLRQEFEENGREVLVLDMDSIIRTKIKIPQGYDLGVFLREDDQTPGTAYEKLGMKVAAGILYVTPEAIDFVDSLRTKLASYELHWFVDQIALYHAYKEVENEYEILNFNGSTLDWEFTPDSAVWTGKGPRKYENETYMKAKEDIDNG